MQVASVCYMVDIMEVLCCEKERSAGIGKLVLLI